MQSLVAAGKDSWILVGLVISGAAWLAIHVALLIRAAGAGRIRPAVRVLALLPPVAPVLAWAAGSRALVVCWILVGATYFSLWLLS